MNNNILKNNEYAKFGYEIVLDGLPDIPEFHVFRPQTRFSSNVIVIFLKSLNVWKDIACRDSLHESFKNVSFHEPDTISLFCLLVYTYFLFILLPHFVLIMYVPIL